MLKTHLAKQPSSEVGGVRGGVVDDVSGVEVLADVMLLLVMRRRRVRMGLVVVVVV